MSESFYTWRNHLWIRRLLAALLLHMHDTIPEQKCLVNILSRNGVLQNTHYHSSMLVRFQFLASATFHFKLSYWQVALLCFCNNFIFVSWAFDSKLLIRPLLTGITNPRSNKLYTCCSRSFRCLTGYRHVNLHRYFQRNWSSRDIFVRFILLVARFLYAKQNPSQLSFSFFLKARTPLVNMPFCPARSIQYPVVYCTIFVLTYLSSTIRLSLAKHHFYDFPYLRIYLHKTFLRSLFLQFLSFYLVPFLLAYLLLLASDLMQHVT